MNPSPAPGAETAHPGPGSGGILPPEQARRTRRVIVATNALKSRTPSPEWKRRAFESIGWPVKGPWCAAWANLIDEQANGGPGEVYGKGYSSSCTRRCVWAHKGSGVDRKTGKIARPALGPGYAPRPPAEIRPGDIVTVGRRRPDGRWARPGGSHCTIAVQGTPAGWWCIGGNQGPRGQVSLDYYPFETERMPAGALRLQWTVSIPDAEYPPAGLVDGAALREAMEYLRERTA